MRQIKFRGLVTDTKEWVFGYYFNHAGVARIFISDKGSYTVIPESVGQFIANNGKQDFYIGDIVVNPQGRKHTVVIFDNCPCLQYTDANGRDWYSPMTSGYLANKRVVGNIHETP